MIQLTFKEIESEKLSKNNNRLDPCSYKLRLKKVHR